MPRADREALFKQIRSQVPVGRTIQDVRMINAQNSHNDQNKYQTNNYQTKFKQITNNKNQTSRVAESE